MSFQGPLTARRSQKREAQPPQGSTGAYFILNNQLFHQTYNSLV
jgi:hypothetical protein